MYSKRYSLLVELPVLRPCGRRIRKNKNRWTTLWRASEFEFPRFARTALKTCSTPGLQWICMSVPNYWSTAWVALDPQLIMAVVLGGGLAQVTFFYEKKKNNNNKTNTCKTSGLGHDCVITYPWTRVNEFARSLDERAKSLFEKIVFCSSCAESRKRLNDGD